jgi:hypothetical protein
VPELRRRNVIQSETLITEIKHQENPLMGGSIGNMRQTGPTNPMNGQFSLNFHAEWQTDTAE